MEQMSDDWDNHWAGLSASAELNPAQRFRHRMLAQLVGRREATTLLDIGSGQGDFLLRVAERDAEIRLVGLELSEVGATQTIEKVPRALVKQVDLTAPGAADLLAGIDADVAVCCEVIEHLDDPEAFLRCARTALSAGAVCFVTVPGGPRSAFDRLIGHRRHYSPAELAELVERCGFVVEDAFGAGFPFFNLYRLVVVARGRRLVDDIGGEGASGTLAARLAMRAFGVLLRFNIPRSRWGWQTVVVATVRPLETGAE